MKIIREITIFCYSINGIRLISFIRSLLIRSFIQVIQVIRYSSKTMPLSMLILTFEVIIIYSLLLWIRLITLFH